MRTIIMMSLKYSPLSTTRQKCLIIKFKAEGIQGSKIANVVWVARVPLLVDMGRNSTQSITWAQD